MGSLADVVQEWALDRWEGSDFTASDDGNRATLKFVWPDTQRCTYRGFCEVTEDRNLLELYLYAPITVPHDRRGAIAEAIARAQASTAIPGRFEIDMDDGLLRYRSGLDVDGAELTARTLDSLVSNGHGMLDQYLPAFTDVAFGDVSPEDAVAAANREPPSPQDVNDAPPWEHFVGSGRLQAWARELRTACELPETADWELTGRAAIIVSDDIRSCKPALQRVAADAGMGFVFVADDDVTALTPPAALRRLAPVLVYLEPGRWMQEPQNGEDEKVRDSMKEFQGRLVEWIREFDGEQPVVFVTSAYKIGDVVESFRHAGLFDRYISLPAPSMKARGEWLVERLGREHCAESVTGALEKVGRLFNGEFATERREALALLRLRRLIACEDRPLEFLDLVNLATHGFAEEDVLPVEASEIRRQTAYHEAGHAAVAIIDSRGRNIPDYSSIVPSAYFKGVVVESYQYNADQGDRITYEDFRHRVRINLAGRAAEDLVFGAERVSNGARSDLESATGYSGAAFAFWGFAPSMGDEGRAGSNLKVSGIDGDELSASENAHVEGLILEFLSVEYAAVKKMLGEHRDLLDAIAERLMWDPIVDQGAMGEIAGEYLG